jgi:hypothetical protein
MIAPKQFDQYLVLNQVVDIPDSTALAQSILDTPVYKRDQPEGLQMRFKPYGYYSGTIRTNILHGRYINLSINLRSSDKRC